MSRQLWNQISCLSIALLIGSTDALQQISTTASTTLVHYASKAAHHKAMNENRDDHHYHPAHKVPIGECTKNLKPGLFFIGQAYSGSTSLSSQMSLHPELSDGQTKEHQFFKSDYKLVQSEAKYKRYLEGFWVGCNVTITYDATMDYLKVAAGTHKISGKDSVKYIRQRMGGDLKIMAMFRDPVDVLFHKEYCSIENGAALVDSRPFTVDKPWNMSERADRPSEMLSTWMKVFPKRSNWLFLNSMEYFGNPQKVLDKVFKFAGVKPLKLQNADLSAQAGRRRCNQKATSEERNAFWSVKDNQVDRTRLEKLTGLTFAWKRK